VKPAMLSRGMTLRELKAELSSYFWCRRVQGCLQANSAGAREVDSGVVQDTSITSLAVIQRRRRDGVHEEACMV
jgi:hypothetical protein